MCTLSKKTDFLIQGLIWKKTPTSNLLSSPFNNLFMEIINITIQELLLYVAWIKISLKRIKGGDAWKKWGLCYHIYKKVVNKIPVTQNH